MSVFTSVRPNGKLMFAQIIQEANLRETFEIINIEPCTIFLCKCAVRTAETASWKDDA
jgi:hypothetical protein